jgi:pyruvate/2-oxoglutarate dehydrogenase complex dihydrolipoamide acyltransferase (E2) component
MIIDVVMPKMGESITEGTILEWKKQIGDSIAMVEILLEIGTDKVDSEIPSSAEGVIVEILAKPNDVIKVGKVIAKIDSQKESSKSDDFIEKTNESLSVDSPEIVEKISTDYPKPINHQKDKKFFSPVVMKIVNEHQIALSELEKISGTGRGGRVTKKDILLYIDEKKKPEPINLKNDSLDRVQKEMMITSNDEEMSHMRQMISKHMVDSLSTSAHVYVMTDVDMSRIVEFVKLNEASFKNQESYNLTYTPFVVQATVKALLEFPKMNTSIEGTKIKYHKNINIGLAVSIEHGLMVPSILHCEEKNFLGICRSVNDIANRAREGRINPDELSGSTFSITNFGVFGVTLGTPIINQPNVAILGVGAIKKRPVVVEDLDGDLIGIKHIMVLSLGFDHRLIDGAEGSKFINSIKRKLETMPLEFNF